MSSADRSRGEGLFRTLFEGAPDALVVFDEAGSIVGANHRLCEIFGWSVDELVGDSVTKLIPPMQGQPPGHVQTLARDTSRLVGARKDGSEFPVDVTTCTLEPPGATRLVMMSLRDATSARQHEAERAASERMATLGLLAASVGHEINNPLAAVITNLDAALAQVAGSLDPAWTRLLDCLVDARSAAERVRLIGRDLKHLSRVRAEVEQPACPRQVCAAVVRLAHSELLPRARVIEEHEGDGRVTLDDPRLGQVLLNLVFNAAQAIAPGAAERNEIRISTRVVRDEVMIAVKDTGGGMSTETRARLFTPFFTTKPAGAGTGLGLAITHRIVTGAGGRIEVESEPGQGTTIRIWLPRAPVAAPTARTARGTERVLHRPGRVLVIDDEPTIRTALIRLLSDHHEVTCVGGAAEALQVLATEAQFDVILCDLTMAGMSGVELHAAVVAAHPDQGARMVFMTGGLVTVVPPEGVARTGRPVIDKPFDVARLRHLIDGMVERGGGADIC